MRRTCLNMIYDLARQDPRVVFIGSDLGAGVLDDMKMDMPDRFFMEGICEQNIIGMAAGLALEGYIPYVNTIATFLTRRCFEQLAIDVCLHNLPVRLIGNGGGMVYAPLGPTHMATDDIAIMRALANMSIVAPADAGEGSRLMSASAAWPGPLYIRLAKGGDPVVSKDEDGFSIGKSILLIPPGEILIVATGIMVCRALEAAIELSGQGIECGVLNMHTLKPLDDEALVDLAGKVRLIVCVEEHSRIGGLGSAVTDCLVENLRSSIPAIRLLAIPDVFPNEYGSQDHLLSLFGLQPPQIAETIRAVLLNRDGS